MDSGDVWIGSQHPYEVQRIPVCKRKKTNMMAIIV